MRPHMQRGGDPDQNLMSVLGMDASSMNFQGRSVVGGAFLWNLLNFFGVPIPFLNQWWLDLVAPGRVAEQLRIYHLESADPRRRIRPKQLSSQLFDGPGRATVRDRSACGRRHARGRAKGELHRMAANCFGCRHPGRELSGHQADFFVVQDSPPVSAASVREPGGRRPRRSVSER